MIRASAAWASKKIAQLFPPGTLGTRFAHGTFWAFLGTVIAQGLGMVASIVTARLLLDVVTYAIVVALVALTMFAFTGLPLDDM